jgi:uncharacterized membrane protein
MSTQCEVTAKQQSGAKIGFFERYLSVWVFLCIIVGIALGHWFPRPFQALGALEVAQVNLPVAILIWLMIIPMLLMEKNDEKYPHFCTVGATSPGSYPWSGRTGLPGRFRA